MYLVESHQPLLTNPSHSQRRNQKVGPSGPSRPPPDWFTTKPHPECSSAEHLQLCHDRKCPHRSSPLSPSHQLEHRVSHCPCFLPYQIKKTMQPHVDPPRLQKTCTECRRRKQKVCETTLQAVGHGPADAGSLQCAVPKGAGPQCSNCAKRWPPVECVFAPVAKARRKQQHPSVESVLVFAVEQQDVASSSRAVSPPRNVGGVMSEINCLNSIGLEDNIRNAELMNICKLSSHLISSRLFLY